MLVQDPFNPSNVFPNESFVTVPELRQAVIEWAFGEFLPPPAVSWRTTTEQEVKWPVGAGH